MSKSAIVHSSTKHYPDSGSTFFGNEIQSPTMHSLSVIPQKNALDFVSEEREEGFDEPNPDQFQHYVGPTRSHRNMTVVEQSDLNAAGARMSHVESDTFLKSPCR
jgi:hypothetical protein